MYKRLTRSRIRVKLASAAYLELDIIKKIIWSGINVRRPPVYARNSHHPPTWG